MYEVKNGKICESSQDSHLTFINHTYMEVIYKWQEKFSLWRPSFVTPTSL